jgi:uncharacterized protein YkwD
MWPLLLALALSILPRTGPVADATLGAAEARLLDLVNAARRERSLRPLERLEVLDEAARRNSRRMARRERLQHTDPAVLERVPLRWTALAENVGCAADVDRVHTLMMRSQGHRGNLLRRDFDTIGIAVGRGPDGQVYVTEVFAATTR